MPKSSGQPSVREGYPVVFVDWVDSCEPVPNAEITAYELPTPQRIFQAGFLVQDDEDHICVAGGLKPECETYDYVIAIPRCSIVAIRYLTINEETEVDE
jgi:hypothetical protein